MGSLGVVTRTKPAVYLAEAVEAAIVPDAFCALPYHSDTRKGHFTYVTILASVVLSLSTLKCPVYIMLSEASC